MRFSRQIIWFFLIVTLSVTGILYYYLIDISMSWQGLGLYGVFLVSTLFILYYLLHPRVDKKTVSPKVDKDIDSTAQLHKKMYQDPNTCLGNQHYFDNQLQQIISEKNHIGALSLIEVQGLKKESDKEEAAFLKKMAQVITDNCQDIKPDFIARINSDHFAIILPQYSEEEILQRTVGLIHALEDLINTNNKKLKINIGLSSLSGQNNTKDLINDAELAIKKAQKAGAFTYAYNTRKKKEANPALTHNIKGWETYINELVETHKVTVIYQPILRFSDKRIHSCEALLRIKNENNNLTAANLIIPMADRFGLTSILDKRVIQQVLNEIDKDCPYAINLSGITLGDEKSLQWLIETLSQRKYHNKIILELNDHTVLNNPVVVEYLMKKLKPYGIGFGLDYHGYDFSGYQYLKNLSFSYLKIDGSYIRDINDQSTQKFISSLIKMTHGLGIQIIAKCVETEEQWNILKPFQLDAAQGIFCDNTVRPNPI